MTQKGVTLIEVLIAMIIIVIASIGTLRYFSYGMGNVGKTGNRRAALERARERLEQLSALDSAELPPQDGRCYYCVFPTCTAISWIAYTCGATPTPDVVDVEDQIALRRETIAQFVDDPAADIYEFSTKVWFINSTLDDDFNRVYLKTLRAP